MQLNEFLLAVNNLGSIELKILSLSGDTTKGNSPQCYWKTDLRESALFNSPLAALLDFLSVVDWDAISFTDDDDYDYDLLEPPTPEYK